MRYQILAFVALALSVYGAGSDSIAPYLPSIVGQPLAELHAEVNNVAQGKFKPVPRFKTPVEIVHRQVEPVPVPETAATSVVESDAGTFVPAKAPTAPAATAFSPMPPMKNGSEAFGRK